MSAESDDVQVLSSGNDVSKVFFVKTPNSGLVAAPHICSTNGQPYRLRVVNHSGERIAVKIRVDGAPTQPDGACRGERDRGPWGFY